MRFKVQDVGKCANELIGTVNHVDKTDGESNTCAILFVHEYFVSEKSERPVIPASMCQFCNVFVIVNSGSGKPFKELIWNYCPIG